MSDSEPTMSLVGTSWVLSSLPGKTLGNGSPATLQFDDGRVSGSDGCNRYTGAYKVEGSKIEFPPRMAGTLMACPPAVQQQADAYLAALNGARAYRISDNRLQLLDERGAELATLVAQSQSLAGTSWRATGINNGKGGVASLRAGTTVTLAFGADGAVSGSAGCNNFTGRYEGTAGQIRFPTAIASTRRMCAAEGVMEQEQAFLKALAASTSARVEGNRLELRDAGGALQISATGT